MVGISDLTLTLGAVIIFSLILLTANRMIMSNTVTEVETEAVGIATTIAQSIIKEAQAKAFDDNTADGSIPIQIPAGFSPCGTDSGEPSRAYFDDFDDYDAYTDSLRTKLGKNSFFVSVQAGYVESPGSEFDSNYCTDASRFKKMVVTVTGKHLEEWSRQIQLSYVRRFYKTTN